MSLHTAVGVHIVVDAPLLLCAPTLSSLICFFFSFFSLFAQFLTFLVLVWVVMGLDCECHLGLLWRLRACSWIRDVLRLALPQ